VLGARQRELGVLTSLVCKMMGHRVARRRVWNDGLDFRTLCQRCGQPLIRSEAGWRPYAAERDDHANREPHPRDRE